MHKGKARVFFWGITAALAGFIFGFDTVVISGAEQAIQEVWELSSAMHGLAVSMALWGTVAGALLGGWPAARYGRKPTLTCIGLLYLLSALGSAFAPEVYTFMIARFVGGIGVGVCTVAAPMYISEIAPAEYRGRLTGLFQFNIVFGILVAYGSNALLADVGAAPWRWMLGVEAIPAFIYFVLCFTLPESPRWLIVHRGEREPARQVFAQIYPEWTAEDLERQVDEVEASAVKLDRPEKFFTARLFTPISLAFLIAFFNQLSGINAVLYFAPRIFAMTGLEAQAALLQSVGIGVTNLIFTFVGLWLIDRLGRRSLLYIGSAGYIASLGLTAWAFHTETYAIVPACIFAFIAAHAVGQGAVIWVFISEIFPNRNRSAGQTLGSSTHWVFAALLTLLFPVMTDTFAPVFIFGFFCFMMCLQLLWVKLAVPETKGITLEEMQRKLGIEP